MTGENIRSRRTASVKTRMVIDLAMTVLIPLLMAYSLIGESFHEIAGSAMLGLFILHQWMNRKWWTALGKGKYTPERVFRTVINLLLLSFMILQPLSGILMSKHLYTFIRIPGAAAWARKIHLPLAYWGMVLMCIHAGTHLLAPLKKLGQNKPKNLILLSVISAAICLYGIIAFVRRGFPCYMLLKEQFVFFDPFEPKVLFFLDYLAIMILFAGLGMLIIHLSGYIRRKNKRETP